MFNQEQPQQQLPVDTVKPDLHFTENEQMYRLITFEEEAKLDDKITELENYITDEDNSGKGKTEMEKDELYLRAQDYVKEYKLLLRDARFNFHLTRPQYRLMTDLLKKKLEYDVNSLFIALELVDMLDNMYGSKFNDDVTPVEYTVTATEITYVYHLLSQHKVKGISDSAKIFASILIRIGEVSKLVSYYDTTAKKMTEDVTQWAIRMNEGAEVIPEVIAPSVDGPQL